MLIQQNQSQYQLIQQQNYNQRQYQFQQRQYQSREPRFESRSERNAIVSSNQSIQINQSKSFYSDQKLLINNVDETSFEHQDQNFQNQLAYQFEYHFENQFYQSEYQFNFIFFQQNYHIYFIDKNVESINVFFNDSSINENKLFAFSCDKCIRRYNNENQLHEHLLKNHKIDSKVSSYIKLIHHISVFLFTIREYIKIIVRTSNRKRRDICLNNDSMMFLIDSKLVNDMHFTSHIMKNVNLIDVNNQITNFYVNYIIKIDDENVFVQAYVINDLTAKILLKVDVIENYNIDLLTFKRMMILNNNEISMSFDRVDDIIVNHNIIESTTLIDSFSLSKIITLKSTFFASCFNSTFRAHFAINYKSETSQKKHKKSDSIQVHVEHKCQRCFRAFCFNNELHRHIVSTHNEFRRRRFSERNHRFRNFVDL